MKRLSKILGILLVFFCSIVSVFAQRQLSEEAKISVLTSAPYDEQVFTVFGHSAFRVHDPASNIDFIFNYGIFDFSKPNFIYRFAKGETDYKLGVTEYSHYIIEYQMRGSSVTEQVLNLTHEEVNHLWTALAINAQPENAVYRYNFFFDNCATRLPEMVEKYVLGEIIYNNPPQPKTFREMVHDCTDGHPWLTFGIDLAIGVPADRVATPHEMMFLPYYVMTQFADAEISNQNGEKRLLVNSSSLIEAIEIDEEGIDWLNILTPLVCFWLLFALIATLTYIGWKKKKTYLPIDIVLFTMAGIAGIVLFFLCFISEHPCIWPNWSALWLHPFHLIGVILFCVKKWKRAAYYYHFINFVAITLLLCGWYFIPQQLNPAFIPLMAMLCVRSWHAICSYKRNI